MLRARWLGSVPYREATDLQRGLFHHATDDYLLLLEHPPVYTLGARAKAEHFLAGASEIGAEMVPTDRGGDVTFHGPGQLVGYPILSVPFRRGVVADHVHSVEQVVIDALEKLGVEGLGRRDGYPGVWIGPSRKVCAIGVRMTRGRTMHGFALNVSTDLSWFDKIVPCGITDARATSLRQEGHGLDVRAVADAIVGRAAEEWGGGQVDYRRTIPRHVGSLAVGHALPVDAREFTGVNLGSSPSAEVHNPVELRERKPPWLRARANMGPNFLALKSTMREKGLVTVCEEAGCPNIFECWSEGTATFMINGERCTRSCGFCLVDTRKPLPVDSEEPERVAEAVARMGLSHAVITAVARDDLVDGGASGFVASIEAVRRSNLGCTVEVLIPDCKGNGSALDAIFGARPDVLNHNLETVLRLQRKVRPSASYARSLAVLARAKAAGLITKSGLMVGLGETGEELRSAIADLSGVGVNILTIGQYLRPSAAHLPVERFWEPGEIEALGNEARSMGFAHVEASPLTRSSYHARRALSPGRAS